MRIRWLVPVLFFAAVSCGGDDADSLGVGAECSSTADCNQDIEPPLSCITGFKGGYCGLTQCQGDADCPEASICVTHTDSVNYCFRACVDKAECNVNRSVDNEANCSSNIDRVDGGNTKACVPPTG